uniref:Si:dkeyp-57d7.4 n=1 Tax=Sinocyclocheilus rhinocerous TaxID=307959 RepID=A0A673M796_9TELE
MLGALEITGSPKHAKDQVPFLLRYTSKTEFLSYVLLYLVKMPFPPVTRPRSLPSSGKEKLSGPSPMFPVSVSATNIPTNSSSPQASSGSGHGLNSESNFSLNLTPEATLLLQKRSREKQLRAVRGTITAPHQKDRLPAKPGSRSNIPLVKISLLNEHHRYDDVEYEKDEQSVDQSVLLKCSEWLRGVENAAGATVLGRVDKISQKSI